MRGFEQNSLGPRDIPLFGQIVGAALGGTKKAIFNAELSTPFPGAGNDRTLRLYGFMAAGNVFGDRTPWSTDAQWDSIKKIRASVGLGDIPLLVDHRDGIGQPQRAERRNPADAQTHRGPDLVDRIPLGLA